MTENGKGQEFRGNNLDEINIDVNSLISDDEQNKDDLSENDSEEINHDNNITSYIHTTVAQNTNVNKSFVCKKKFN